MYDFLVVSMIFIGIKVISDKLKSNPRRFSISERSNVIQYDCNGNPLRLVIMNNGEQCWLDTIEEQNDVILEWRSNINE